MCRIYLSLILLIIMLSPAFAQENLVANEYESLSKQLSSDMTTKGLAEIESKANDIFKADTKQFANDNEKLANMTLDFALFRKQLSQILKTKTINSKVAKSEIISHFEFSRENEDKLENLLEQSIELYEKTLEVENEQLATAKFELANYLDGNNIRGKDYYNAKKQFERVNKIQELYLGAYTLWKQLRNKDDELVLVVSFHLANSYLRTSDFEKALPYYEKYIEGVTEKFGKKSENLLPALQITAVIWNMLGNKDLVGNISKQISVITNKDEDMSEMLLSVSQRAKSSKYKGLNKTFDRIDFSNSIRGTVDKNDPLTRVNLFEIGVKGANNPNGYYRGIVRATVDVKLAKVVRTVIEIDPEGKVIQVNAETDDIKRKNKIEKQVKKWEFKPFIYKGTPMRITGVVYYYF